MNKIKAVFFDLDETLIDAYNAHDKACYIAFEKYGLDFEDAAKRINDQDFLGRRVIDWLEALRNSLDVTEKQLPLKKLAKTREEIFLKILKKESKLLPGARTALKISQDNFEVTAIVSSGTKKYINQFLSQYQLKKYVDLIVVGDDVKRGKPYPDCYLKAFKMLPKKLKIKKDECLAIEDAANGVRSAQAAGLKVLMVPFMPSKQKVKPEFMIKNLKGFDKKFIELISKKNSL